MILNSLLFTGDWLPLIIFPFFIFIATYFNISFSKKNSTNK